MPSAGLPDGGISPDDERRLFGEYMSGVHRRAETQGRFVWQILRDDRDAGMVTPYAEEYVTSIIGPGRKSA